MVHLWSRGLKLILSAQFPIRSIVEHISVRHVDRLLAEAELKPHQSRYWLHPPPDPDFQSKVEDLCQVYEQASAWAERGEVTRNVDEMTGIPARERVMPDLAMKPGRCARVEFEYERHGTQTLIACFNVATGRIDQATVGGDHDSHHFTTAQFRLTQAFASH